jgi:hypothetical protein
VEASEPFLMQMLAQSRNRVVYRVRPLSASPVSCTSCGGAMCLNVPQDVMNVLGTHRLNDMDLFTKVAVLRALQVSSPSCCLSCLPM